MRSEVDLNIKAIRDKKKAKIRKIFTEIFIILVGLYLANAFIKQYFLLWEDIMITKEKGITLIALVITIIVLLILAGVTIVTLSGENRITKKGSNCKRNINR